MVTRDGGDSWTDATPDGIDAVAGMKGVYFVDDRHGWVLTAHTGADERTQLVLDRTADGGRTWSETPVAEPDLAFTDSIASAASVDFVSPDRGWLLVPLTTSSNFSRGRLFATEDGGATWTELPAPGAGALYFLDARNGWMYTDGGPPSLFRTEDGGRTWRAAR